MQERQRHRRPNHADYQRIDPTPRTGEDDEDTEDEDDEASSTSSAADMSGVLHSFGKDLLDLLNASHPDRSRLSHAEERAAMVRAFMDVPGLPCDSGADSDDDGQCASRTRRDDIQSVVDKSIPTRRGERTRDERVQAARAAMLLLTVYETTGRLGRRRFDLVKESTYSAALVMPQIARSSRWSLKYTTSAMEALTVAVLTMLLQGFMIYCLRNASVNMARVNGEPNMCTYGTDFVDGGLPRGPLGVRFTRDLGNLGASYDDVRNTNIMWLALQRLGQSDLADLIGPVDLGIQSPTCRLVCMGIFCVSVWSTGRDVVGAWKFLWASPTTDGGAGSKDLWIGWADEPRHRNRSRVERFANGEMDLLDAVVFKMNGMPRKWKFVAGVFVSFETLAVVTVGYFGSRVLLSSGNIMDLILNCTALAFILEMDRITYKALARSLTGVVMDKLEPYQGPRGNITKKLMIMREKALVWTVRDLMTMHLWYSLHIAVVPVLLGFFYLVYLHANCELVRAPFSTRFVTAGSEHYFSGLPSLFGGFDWWMGRWVSKNISVAGKVTCQPYHPDRPYVRGCGLPEDWTATLQRVYGDGN